MREGHDAEPTQLTQPKGRDKDGKPYEPIEIPVPTRSEVEGFFRKVFRPGKGDAKPASPSRKS
jgi:hypothetical protein